MNRVALQPWQNPDGIAGRPSATFMGKVIGTACRVIQARTCLVGDVANGSHAAVVNVRPELTGGSSLNQSALFSSALRVLEQAC